MSEINVDTFFNPEKFGYIEKDGFAFLGFQLPEGVSPFETDKVWFALDTEKAEEIVAILQDHISRNK